MPLNFLSGFAETKPRGILANLLRRERKPVRDFFGSRFNELYSEYLGRLSEQPTLGFGGFLGGLNLQNRLMTFSPQQRGIRHGILQPRTRFLPF